MRRIIVDIDGTLTKVGTVDPLVSQVVDAIKTGGWNRDLATRIIAMVREHDAGKVIVPDLYWKYEGQTGFYHVMLNGKSVFATKETYQRDMFMAELKLKISKPTGGANG